MIKETTDITKNQNAYLGIVTKVKDGIATIKGLNKVKSGEVLDFASGAKGLALNLSHKKISIWFFDIKQFILLFRSSIFFLNYYILINLFNIIKK
jgi:F0F1-type ATP synthase alpha subunit